MVRLECADELRQNSDLFPLYREVQKEVGDRDTARGLLRSAATRLVNYHLYLLNILSDDWLRERVEAKRAKQEAMKQWSAKYESFLNRLVSESRGKKRPTDTSDVPRNVDETGP